MTTTNKISISGLVSGYDTDSLVTAMTAMMKLGVSEAQDQQKVTDARLTGYKSLETTLTALKTSTDRLSKSDNWKLHSATVSDTSVMTATATAGASPGTYQLQVTSLAQAQQKISQGFSGTDAVLGTGTVSISLGSATFSAITLDSSNNTLQGLSDAINAANLTVKASIINDGSETNPYHLLLTSSKTGASRTIGFTSNLTGGEATPTFTVLQEATDAKVVIGSASTSTLSISSNSNTLSNAIPGVTLQLLEKSDTPVNVTVQDDSTSAKAMINNFISNYNATADFLKEATAYDAETKQGGVLQGDYAATSLQSQLADTAIAAQGTGTYKSLTDIGITMGTDGHLSITDGAALTSALQSNWDAVTDLFTNSETGVATRVSTFVENQTSTNGNLALRETSLQEEHDSYDEMITRKQTILDAQIANLKNQFTAMEKALNTFHQQMSMITNIFVGSASSSSSSSSSSTSSSS